MIPRPPPERPAPGVHRAAAPRGQLYRVLGRTGPHPLLTLVVEGTADLISADGGIELALTARHSTSQSANEFAGRGSLEPHSHSMRQVLPPHLTAGETQA